MEVEAWVTTGGDPLSLTTAPYHIEGESGVEFGGLTWRRTVATSPFVHGGFPVTQVKENAQLLLTIQVRSDSQDNLASQIAALVAAFSQFEYEFHVTYDDVEWAYTCWSADMSVGSHDERMGQYNVAVKITAPRSPMQLVDGGI